MEWKVVLVNFLNSEPGSKRVSLNYFVRYNQGRFIRTNTNLLYNYVNRTPLIGRAFTSDASKLNSYLVRLISENSVAEKNILPQKDSSGGRVNFMALK